MENSENHMKTVQAISQNNKTELAVQVIKTAVAAYYKQPYTVYQDRTRKREIVNTKYTAIYFIRRGTRLSLDEIGALFNYDHATILHACRRVNDIIATEKNYAKEIEELQAIVSLGMSSYSNNDFYYIDINNCVSVKESPSRAVIFTDGFTEAQMRLACEALSITKYEPAYHEKTGMFILKTDKNGK